VLVESAENALFEIEQELRRISPHCVVPCLVDVRAETEVAEVFAEHRPQVVFHAAAYKHVPMMEHYPGKAILNNVRGTRVVAEAARRFRAERFLLVSTDKAVNPTSVMGATKRAAEMVVLDQGGPTRFSAVRFGNVLGSNGSVVHTFSKQIEAGGPVTVTHPDITRFFMTIPEAVRLVLQAAAIGDGGDVFLLDMGEPVKIVDLARQMIRLAGHDESEIPIRFTGLRPGEKLHEELLRRGEASEPSGVPSIWRATNAGAAFEGVGRWIARLEAAAEDGDIDEAGRLLYAGTGLPLPAPLEDTDPGQDVRERAARRASGIWAAATSDEA
jgi:FlaA1/EpsC-like NDP-sugar epimerase